MFIPTFTRMFTQCVRAVTFKASDFRSGYLVASHPHPRRRCRSSAAAADDDDDDTTAAATRSRAACCERGRRGAARSFDALRASSACTRRRRRCRSVSPVAAVGREERSLARAATRRVYERRRPRLYVHSGDTHRC